MILNLPIVIWAIATAISRICLARHHILDVCGGFVLALIEYGIMTMIWLNEDKARSWAAFFANTDDPWSSG